MTCIFQISCTKEFGWPTGTPQEGHCHLLRIQSREYFFLSLEMRVRYILMNLLVMTMRMRMVVTMLEGEQDDGLSKMRYKHYNHKWLDYEERITNSRPNCNYFQTVPIINLQHAITMCNKLQHSQLILLAEMPELLH